MKSTKAIIVLLVSLTVALAASAVTPTPSAKPSAAPQPSSTNPQTIPAPKPSPTAKPTPVDLASPSEELAPRILSTPANAGPPPKPILYLMEQVPFTANGKNWIRYRYDVLNKAEYPADMFAAAPSLPPCGSNTNASRTWVDFFDSTGKRLYGFCALSKPADLGKIWFAMEEGVIPPSYVYIELNDRQTNTKYKSNLADTTI
jgi:hypothetical protein